MWSSAVTQRYRIILYQLSSNVLYELYWAYHKHWWSPYIIKQLIPSWSIYPIWLFQTVVLSNEFLKQVIKRIFSSTLIWLVCLALERIRSRVGREIQWASDFHSSLDPIPDNFVRNLRFSARTASSLRLTCVISCAKIKSFLMPKNTVTK